MPCYDHTTSPKAVSEAVSKKYQKVIDKYARWLCYLIWNHVELRNLNDLPPDLLKWWEEHQKFDEERKRK